MTVWEGADDELQPAREVPVDDPGRYVDLCLLLSAHDQAGLLLAWNPNPGPELPVASYLCVTSSTEETFSGLKPGETAVMFRVPEFAVASGMDSQGRPL